MGILKGVASKPATKFYIPMLKDVVVRHQVVFSGRQAYPYKNFGQTASLMTQIAYCAFCDEPYLKSDMVLTTHGLYCNTCEVTVPSR